MANKPITMLRLRQVLRYFTQGTSKKQISEITGVARNTVKRYIGRFISLKMTYEEIVALSDHELEQLFIEPHPALPDARFARLQELLPEIEKQMKRKGITLIKLWQDYYAANQPAYQYTQFKKYYKFYSQRVRPVMHIEHKAGDKMYIDFAGEKLSIVAADTGEMQEHYGTVVLPARAYRPKDKSLVEGVVKIMYHRIYSRIAPQIYHSLASLNQALREALEAHNNGSFKGRNYGRRDQFEELERQALRPLPVYRYEYKQQQICTVMKNGHACLGPDKHYYSVPYRYIGKRVKLLYTSTQVEVFYKYERIATHSRQYRKYHYTTQPEHLASAHRYLSEWTPEKFIEEARAIHESVARYIIEIIERKQHPEQAYKSCSGILNLKRKVGSERLAGACRRAHSFGVYNYPIIVQILEKKLDQLTDDEKEELPMPQHANIRGENYYE
jgi:transposase